MRLKVGIIGGGVMGLTLAYRLSQEGHGVQVIESREQLGGLSTWFDYGPFTWDKYYHVILKQDSELLNLIEELQLEDKLSWQPTKTGFLWNKKLVSMSNYWEFFRFPALNLYEKLRLGLGILHSSYLQNPEKLQKISAKEWLLQIFGKGVYDTIWEPLLESKFGVLKEKVPAFLLCATIKRYYGTRNKTDGKEWMGYLRGGGLKNLLKALEERIINREGIIRCGEKVEGVMDENPGHLIVNTSGGQYQFDKVISTLPSFLFKKLNRNFNAAKVFPVRPAFLGVIRLALILKKSISPFYVTNLIDKNLPYTGIIELSRVVDIQEFSNKTLVMIPRYDVPDSEWFTYSDNVIEQQFLASLKKTWPAIEKDIIGSFVDRERIVQAVWIEGLPAIEPWISGDGRIWSVNAELSGFDSLNNNGIVKVANHYAQKFLKSAEYKPLS